MKLQRDSSWALSDMGAGGLTCCAGLGGQVERNKAVEGAPDLIPTLDGIFSTHG